MRNIIQKDNSFASNHKILNERCGVIIIDTINFEIINVIEIVEDSRRDFSF